MPTSENVMGSRVVQTSSKKKEDLGPRGSTKEDICDNGHSSIHRDVSLESKRPPDRYHSYFNGAIPKYLVEPAAYVRNKQRTEELMLKGDESIGVPDDGTHLHWDDLVVAMILEKARELSRGNGILAIHKAIEFFQHHFPHIENFARLHESTVRAWASKPVYSNICGRKAITRARKVLVKGWIDEHMRSWDMNGSYTVDVLWKAIHRRMEHERQCELEAGREEPELLRNWSMPLSWFAKFVCRDLGLHMRQTTIGREPPANWEDLKVAFCDKLAVRAKEFQIPPDLVVNADQRGWCLSPHIGDTSARKSSGCGSAVDKSHVTMMVALSAHGDILPLQFIFKGKTDLVRTKKHKEYVERHDWLFSTNPESHWASLQTMKEWVGKVVHPYFCEKMMEKHMIGHCSVRSVKVEEITQRCILIVDCWKVHVSKEFRDWMKEKYPYISLLFIPAGFTSQLQVIDLIGNYTLKILAIQEFENHLLQDLQKQVDEGGKRTSTDGLPDQYTFDLRLSTLGYRIPTWAEKGYLRLKTEEGKRMIEKGWEECGLREAFSHEYQYRALRRMYNRMQMDTTQRDEWELFNCQQKDKDFVTRESQERWEDNVDEAQDADPDQDQPGIADTAIGEGQHMNAMAMDSIEDYGMWERLCAYAIQYIHGDTVVQQRKMTQGCKDTYGSQTPRKRSRPRKIRVVFSVDDSSASDKKTADLEDILEIDEDDQANADAIQKCFI